MSTPNFGLIELDPNSKFSLVEDFNTLANQIDNALLSIKSQANENANRIVTLNANLKTANDLAQSAKTSADNANYLAMSVNEDLINQQLNGSYSKLPSIAPPSGVTSSIEVLKANNGAYFFAYGALTFSSGTYTPTQIPGANSTGFALVDMGFKPNTAQIYQGVGLWQSWKNNPFSITNFNYVSFILGTDGILYLNYGETSLNIPDDNNRGYRLIQTKLTLKQLNIELPENVE